MAAIKVYVLDDNNFLSHTRTGDIGSLMHVIEQDNERYTLTPPPDEFEPWQWVDGQWFKNEASQ